MIIKILLTLLFPLSYLSVYSQSDKDQVTKVLSTFLENSSNGNYVGWNGPQEDSLWLDATQYVEKVRAFGKTHNQQFNIVQTDNAYFTLSYSLDSISIYSDHALGFVTLYSASYGYVASPLIIKKQRIDKVYLLVKQNNRWFVLSETNDWFISVKKYIKWAEKSILDKSTSPEFTRTVTSNLNSFKKLIN